MRIIRCLFFLMVVITSCQVKQNESTTDSDEMEFCLADTVKPTAIFWVDKSQFKYCKEYGFRTVKAQVSIHENGKVDLRSFIKKQSIGVEKYLRHHLAKFQVTKKMLENDYIKPGDQCVQLRYLPSMVKDK